MLERRKHGILVVNEFLYANKYSELYEWFENAAEKYHMKLTIKTNASLLVSDIKKMVAEEQIDFVLFWDKDIRLAQYLEFVGLPVFNSAKAVEACDDKSYTYLLLEQAGIAMPKTIIGPKTFESVNYTTTEFLDIVSMELGFPMIIKECYGSFGQQVYMVHTKEELLKKVKETSPKPIIFQEFIKTSFAKDLRLQVVGDQVVASMYRYSDTGDFRANISNGGKMRYYEPTKEEQTIALKSCEAIGLDFAGVDLLFGEEGQPLVCEVNSNAHFRNIYDCTQVNVAEMIMEYILNKL